MELEDIFLIVDYSPYDYSLFTGKAPGKLIRLISQLFYDTSTFSLGFKPTSINLFPINLYCIRGVPIPRIGLFSNFLSQIEALVLVRKDIHILHN